MSLLGPKESPSLVDSVQLQPCQFDDNARDEDHDGASLGIVNTESIGLPILVSLQRAPRAKPSLRSGPCYLCSRSPESPKSSDPGALAQA